MKYNYKGFDDCDSVCELRIEGNVICVTEIDENLGTSITNVTEQLATQVCREKQIKDVTLIWIEHYPEDTAVMLDEHFSLVQFNLDINGVFSNPRWTPISKAAVEALLEG